MRYHNITKDDMLNGEGLRVVLWVAGCSHGCKNCQTLLPGTLTAVCLSMRLPRQKFLQSWKKTTSAASHSAAATPYTWATEKI